MANSISKVPLPINEPINSYAPGNPERERLKKSIKDMISSQIEVPMFIGGKEITTGDFAEMRCPHDKSTLLGKYHKGSEEHVAMAVKACENAKTDWERLPWEDRASVFLKAADLLSTKYRDTLNVATMLGQSKNAFQAEIDSACELIDFWRYNPYYAAKVYDDQPGNSFGVWNRVEYRPLEGFVFAVTPFNFTSIAGNLPTSPALMGNCVIWKPASSAVYSAHFIMQILKEAGLPDGVINLVLGSGGKIGNPIMDRPELSGIHFTGSTATFQSMWKHIGNNIQGYKTYPRIVGETGGKDFIIAHHDCDVDALCTAIVRGAYEYQGQKCSAASRAYIPKSVWNKLQEKLINTIKELKMGDVQDFSNFVNAVIDQNAFNDIKAFIDYAKNANDAKILIGGKCDDSKGYFIEPTVILTDNPHFKTMEEEIFGPVLTVYVYDDNKLDETLETLDKTSMYALTGAIFARDRHVINKMAYALRNSSGNFYINDKPTGAVVGQQPFGGSRGSGTNDKAGSYQNLLRWISTRAIKENFIPPRDYKYPFMMDK